VYRSSFLRFNGADGKDHLLAFELSIRHFAATVRVICDPGYGSRPEMKWPLNRASVEEENYDGNGEKNDSGSSPPTYDRGLNWERRLHVCSPISAIALSIMRARFSHGCRLRHPMSGAK